MEFSNPFDSPQSRFFILENTLKQFSLWPEHCAIPDGWLVVCEAASNEECNRWLLDNWTQLQPTTFAKPGVSGE
ncbi:MbtH family NRPS accessory protein [Buttiauxella sp. B2]|uniref:MbtH family protein n=1 Tax=Buttiauxella sp. B2 TaxID=2587812 RepID=UPI001121CCA5|nr:MbtH family NRPS accessory protein [Buttiauxella sp. B2]TNV20708.1 MbtH family NRPS accessory protein [Buttiauxella sp. B2]